MNKELNLAYKVLNNVYFKGAYASIELNKSYISNLNFNLVTKITYGVIDDDVKLDYFVKQFYKKAPKKEVTLIFKLAAYLSQNINSIPKFAVVNELVEIAKHSKLKPYVSFINAVLKKIVNAEFVLPDTKDKRLYLSIKYSKPLWFIDLMLKNFSDDFVVEFFEAELTNLTHIRVNTLKIKYADFVSKLKELDIDYTTSTLDDALFVEYSKIVREESLNGLYTPQGIPSMIVSRNVVGNTILDACSAPGGKAVYIATLNPNSKVIACDYYEHRAQLINDYSSRMSVENVTTKVLDATNFVPEFEGKFDCVLLDVPCSGLGVIDKKPDLLINNDLDFLSLPDLQLKILENNSKYVKSGGSIVYSTCTILPTENEDIITKFLQKHPNFRLDTVDTFGVLCDDKGGLKTFYPHISKTEGFFIGKLVRND